MVDEIQRVYEVLKAVFSEGSGGRREAPQGRVDPKAVACLSIPAGSSALAGLRIRLLERNSGDVIAIDIPSLVVSRNSGSIRRLTMFMQRGPEPEG